MNKKVRLVGVLSDFYVKYLRKVWYMVSVCYKNLYTVCFNNKIKDKKVLI